MKSDAVWHANYWLHKALCQIGSVSQESVEWDDNNGWRPFPADTRGSDARPPHGASSTDRESPARRSCLPTGGHRKAFRANRLHGIGFVSQKSVECRGETPCRLGPPDARHPEPPL